MFRAALLDVDGTLVDSNDAHARSYVEAFHAFGRPEVTFDDVRPLIGMGGGKLVPKLLGAGPLPSPELRELASDIDEEKGRRFRAHYLPRLEAFPGTNALVRAFCAAGSRLVVASSGSAEDVEAILAHVGLSRVLDERVTSDDADRSKPDPDILRAAVRKTGLPSEDHLFVGDTPYDVRAGRAAGVPTIALRSGGGWSDGAFDGALAIYDGPGALAAHLGDWLQSPPRTAAMQGSGARGR